MRNEGADIVQDHSEDLKESARDLKEKARVAGAAAWDMTRATYEELQDRTIACSQATDRAIRENPYTSLGVAFGVGLVLGLLWHRGSDSQEKNC